MKPLLPALLAALALAPAALAAPHGFRDGDAPRQMAAIENARPQVDNTRCWWKVRGHTIGCTALVAGIRTQVYVWSDGSPHPMERLCAGGVCFKQRAKITFGHPY